MRDLTGIMLAFLMVLTILNFFVNVASAQETVKPETLTLTVYPDGIVYVDYRVTVDPSYPRVNITVFGKTTENLIVTDGEGYPLDYTLMDDVMTVDSLGVYEVKISYTTKDLVMFVVLTIIVVGIGTPLILKSKIKTLPNFSNG